MDMTIEEYAHVQEFLFDHYEHFDAWPAEVETNLGTVYQLADF